MINPFDLVEAEILTFKGSMKIWLRPYRFDSEPVDFNTLKNAFGNVIKPTQFSSSCPYCGCLVDVAMTYDMKYKCIECYKEPKQVSYPFVADPIGPISHLIYKEHIQSSDGDLSYLLDKINESEQAYEVEEDEEDSPFRPYPEDVIKIVRPHE